ncbi:MAG: hypothetical protein K0S68_601 [Candidatus Saccharibacteria bacterium]|nr:hypothetical protein [Candidatus Saccharibacteria bacterium]
MKSLRYLVSTLSIAAALLAPVAVSAHDGEDHGPTTPSPAASSSPSPSPTVKSSPVAVADTTPASQNSNTIAYATLAAVAVIGGGAYLLLRKR